MNKIFLLFLSYFIQIFTAKTQTINQIKIISIPIYTTTIIRVTCGQFDKEFNDSSKKTIFLNGKDDIKKVNLLLNKEQPIAYNEIDVRGEIILYFNCNKTKKICFDAFGNFFDGAKGFENKLLYQFLLDSHYIEI